MKFSIKDFFSKCDQIRMKQRICGYGRLTEEIVNGKLLLFVQCKNYKVKPFQANVPLYLVFADILQ